MNVGQNKMKKITLILLLCSTAVLRAENADAAKWFSHPNAVLRFDGLITGKLKPVENFSHGNNTPESKWDFRSSVLVEVASKKKISASWEFITKSEYGDIYVISFTDQNMKKVVRQFRGLSQSRLSRLVGQPSKCLI